MHNNAFNLNVRPIIMTDTIKKHEGLIIVVSGLSLPLLCTFLIQLLYVWGKPFSYEIALFIMYGGIVGLLTYRNVNIDSGKLFLLYFLLPIGVVIDATIHLNLHNYVYDRNLLPFEILYFLIITPIPIFFGKFVGKKLGQKENDSKRMA